MEKTHSKRVCAATRALSRLIGHLDFGRFNFSGLGVYQDLASGPTLSVYNLPHGSNDDVRLFQLHVMATVCMFQC